MRPVEERSFRGGPALIDVSDEEQLRLVAEQLESTPEEIAEAVEAVGPNLTAVEMQLGVSVPDSEHKRLGDVLKDAGGPRAD